MPGIDLKSQLTQQGDARVLIDASTAFSVMAAEYKAVKGQVITIKQGYLSAQEVAYELRSRVKDKTTKPPEALRPLFDDKLPLADFSKNAAYKDFVEYLEKLKISDFEPPLEVSFPPPAGSGATGITDPVPNYVSKDARRTGKLYVIDPADVAKSIDFQKWMINNSVLYGFLVYDTYHLYYVGLDRIQNSLKGADPSTVKKYLSTFIKSADLIGNISVTLKTILDAKSPLTLAFETNDDFAHPLGPTGRGPNRGTGLFGWREFGDGKQPKNYHPGLDIGCSMLAPVFAVADGKVVRSNNECRNDGDITCGGHAGNRVEIQHADSVTSIYMHLSYGWWGEYNNNLYNDGQKDPRPGKGGVKLTSEVIQKEFKNAKFIGYEFGPGNTVKKATKFGYAGSTGQSDGPHLHFEMLVTSPNSKYANARCVRYHGVQAKDGKLVKYGPRLGTSKDDKQNNTSDVIGTNRNNWANPLLLVKALKDKVPNGPYWASSEGPDVNDITIKYPNS